MVELFCAKVDLSYAVALLRQDEEKRDQWHDGGGKGDGARAE